MEPAGRGIGPILEIKESLMVLEQKPDRALDLEIRSLNLATNLLEMCIEDVGKEEKEKMLQEHGNAHNLALYILQSGMALEKFKQIIKAQGGNPNIDSDDLKPGKQTFEKKASFSGIVNDINIKNLTTIAKILGAPKMKGSGIYLNKKIGETVKEGDTLYTLFSENVYNLKEGKDSLGNFPIVYYE